MDKSNKNINEEINRIKSLFTEERMYGNLVGDGDQEVIEEGVIKTGSEPDVVKPLQILLGVKDDGIFGPKTKEALMKFQDDSGLEDDGIAGEETVKALHKKFKINESNYSVISEQDGVGEKIKAALTKITNFVTKPIKNIASKVGGNKNPEIQKVKDFKKKLKTNAVKGDPKPTDTSVEGEKETDKMIKVCNKRLQTYSELFFKFHKNKRVNYGELEVGDKGKIKKGFEGCIQKYWNDDAKELSLYNWGVDKSGRVIDKLTEVIVKNNTSYLSDGKGGDIDPSKKETRTQKTEADTSFKGCKANLSKISKITRKYGSTIEDYVQKYPDSILGPDGDPIVLSKDILGAAIQGCLKGHFSRLGLWWDAKKGRWSGSNKMGDAVVDIIQEWDIDFEQEKGGTTGNVYDVMKGNLPIGKVEKTGNNMYKYTTKFKDYAFRGEDINDKYVALIKNSINTDKELNVKKIKGGTAIFSLI
jgi:peptidoglycan hydrolase-like protein with peptidoglycan-binding domain